MNKKYSSLIMGLDPGTIHTGFAIIETKEQNFNVLNLDIISASPKKSIQERLAFIGKHLEEIYQQYSIAETAIEQIFLGKNPDSAFKLGQVFGICVYQAMRFESLIFPYAARFVKKAITGSGTADKEAVQNFVLNICSSIPPQTKNDATDALAVAMCHFYQKQNKISRQGIRSTQNTGSGGFKKSCFTKGPVS